jgi:hypothetical protein
MKGGFMPRDVTMSDYLVGRVGLLKAVKVVAFIVAWGIYVEKNDEPHTLDGYTKYWRQSESTTYRERDLFRICFPGQKTPERVWADCRAVYDAKASRDQMAARLLHVRSQWS